MPVNLEDAMKVLLPLVAGGVSAYSRPAARAIQGATGAYMAMDEDKRREEQQAQELALRNKEADLRGQEIAASTARTKAGTDLAQGEADRKATAAQTLGATLGSVIANLRGAGPMTPGTTTPEGAAAGAAVEGSPGISEEQVQNHADLANAATIAQGALGDDRLAGPALDAYTHMPEGQARLAQAFQQYKDTLAQRQAEHTATQEYRSKDLAIRERGAAAREKDANTRATEAAAKDKPPDAAKAAKEIDPNKLASDITKAEAALGDAQAANDPAQVALISKGLRDLYAKRALATGANTPAGYLDKLGLGANR